LHLLRLTQTTKKCVPINRKLTAKRGLQEELNGLVVTRFCGHPCSPVSKNTLALISTASILKQVLSASQEQLREKEKTRSQFFRKGNIIYLEEKKHTLVECPFNSGVNGNKNSAFRCIFVSA
jgi:hypothetical protein